MENKVNFNSRASFHTGITISAYKRKCVRERAKCEWGRRYTKNLLLWVV